MGERLLEILTVSQTYAADKETTAKIVPEFNLMENAAFALVCEITKRIKKAPVFVLCGNGNNGGDGFAAARLLERRGWPVEVVMTAPPAGLKGAALKHASLWKGKTSYLTPSLPERIRSRKGVIIDAMFGIGLNRLLPDDVSDFVRKANAMELPFIAVDLPSGVKADTGEIAGDAPKCLFSVTFGRPKPAHFLYPAKERCGETVVCPIGIPDDVIVRQKPFLFVNGTELFTLPEPDAGSHKYSRGGVLICGGEKMTGAARLSARAARRAGAGWVAVAANASSAGFYTQDAAENVVFPLNRDSDFDDLVVSGKIRSIVIGPGNGVTQETERRLKTTARSGKPFVADADALAFVRDVDLKNAVLTPHAGEFYRLFPDLKSSDKISAALQAAERLNTVVVFKGADTVVASPAGIAAIQDRTSFELSVAGSGDVLAGIAGTMLAKGLPPFQAACAAVFLHSAAGIAAGRNIIASDIIDCLKPIP